MSDNAKAFFDAWVVRTFAADLPWMDLFPTPLAALTDLRAQARLHGIGVDHLESAVGDLVAAVLTAMLDAPAPDASRFGRSPDLASAGGALLALELALSYVEGLREAVGSDHNMMASLMQHYLARQGFALRRLEDGPAHLALRPVEEGRALLGSA